MAQLNDLLVSGASRLLNGLGILGTTNADSIVPNTTETYELGSSSKKWKTAYIKTISANDMTLAILTVTNYATIGGGQAATAANTGALRIAGGLSATQNSFFSQNVTATKFIGPLEGNADSATVLKTARTINGTSFNGSANITTSYWGTARNFTISDNSQTNKGTAVSVNGSGAVNLLLPATIQATLSGNASSASVLGQDSRMNYGWNGLNYFNISGTAGNAAKTNDTPTTAWWHILRFNHANSSGYYTDLAIPFNANSLYYKRIGNGAVQNGGWVKVLDALNYTSVLDSSYVNVSGDTMSGNLTAPTYIATQKMVVGSTGLVDLTAAGTTRLYADGLAISNPTTKNDDAWIRVTGTGESDTFLEIATGDDAGGSTAEQIVVRQYGSSGLAHEIKLLDGSGNTYLKRLIMNGALDLANGTWNKAGDDAQFGDNNTAGSFAIQGLNGNTNLKMVTYGSSSYGTMTWDGSFFKFSNKVYSNGSLVMTSANFSLSGTTLTITTT